MTKERRTQTKKCPACNGKGFRNIVMPGFEMQSFTCKKCYGFGKIPA